MRDLGSAKKLVRSPASKPTCLQETLPTAHHVTTSIGNTVGLHLSVDTSTRRAERPGDLSVVVDDVRIDAVGDEHSLEGIRCLKTFCMGVLVLDSTCAVFSGVLPNRLLGMPVLDPK